MKVMIVSDTHGRDENLEIAINREAPFDMLVHCGDVEGREIFIEALVDCPCCIVAGNNDFFSDLPREEEMMEIRFLSRMEIIMVCPWIFPVSQKKQSPETVMLCSLDTRISL